MNRSTDSNSNDLNDDGKTSIVLNLACFIGAIAGGFGLFFLLPDWTGIMFIYWSAFVLFIAPQVAIWSDSRRVKMAAWSGFLGAICLLILFFYVVVPFSYRSN
jgi:hypothetical protein